MPSVLRRLLGETVIYSLTPLLSSLVGLLLVPIYTRQFSPSDYGALAQVNTTTTFAAMIVVFGLDNSAAIWFWDQPEPEARARTWSTWAGFTFGTSLLIAALAATFSRPLAAVILKDESLAPMWLLFSANIVAFSFPRIGILWFRMQRSPWSAVSLAAAASLGNALFSILFVVHFRFGLPGIIGGQAVGSWLGALATLFALRRVVSPRKFHAAQLLPMLKLSAPLVLMGNLSWLMGSAVTYFVNFLCSREDAGLYQVASSLSSILGLVMFAFDQAWLPFALSIRDEATARRVYGVAVEASLVLGLLMAFTATLFARPILLVFTHPQYVAAEWVLAILALNTVLVNVPSILSVTFAREKLTMPLAKATAVGVVVTVALLPFLARAFGKEGAAASVVLGSVVIFVVTFRASQLVFPIDVRLPRVAAASVASALAAAAFYFTRTLTSTMGGMIALRSALVVGLALALALLYRGPLRAAWTEGRAARQTS